MAVTTAAVIGLAGSAAGAYSSYQGAKAQQNAAGAAIDAVGRTTDINPFVANAGGFGPSARYDGTGVNLDFGQYNPVMQGLAGFAGQQSGGLGQIPQGLQQALVNANSNSQFFNPVDAQQSGLSGQLGSAFQQAQDAYGQQFGAARPGLLNLQNTAFTGAANQAALASQGFNDVQASTLATLRQQAQPFEQRQFQGLQNNLFATGRLGTSGGGLQTEAFARGLGQADLQRQLSASNEARLTQQQALGQAQGLSGIGSGLLNDAFNQFGQAQNMFSNSLQQRFGNAALSNAQNFNQSTQSINNAMAPQGLQSAQLQNLIASINASGGLQQQGLNLFNSGLNAQQISANARLGQQSNAVSAAQNPNIGAGNDALGQIFSGIGQRIGGGQSATDLLGRVFGNYSFNNIGSGGLGNSALADAGFGG